MKFLTIILLIILISLLTFSSLTFPDDLINVPLDHWSYQFVERLQAKGVLKEYLSSSKPYTRGEMFMMTTHISRLIRNGELKLTSVEMDLLEEMKKEFAQELGISGYKHLVNWTDGEMKLVAQLGIAQDCLFSTEDNKYQSTLNFLFYGDILRNLSFYSSSRASYEPDKEYPTAKQRQHDPRYYHARVGWSSLGDAYFVYGNSRVSLQAGKDAIRWGPGYHGVIGLADVEPTFDIVRFRTRMWKVNFTSVLGFLRDDLAKKYLSNVPRKYLTAHRFEILPYPGVCIAWQEVYIYAEKLQFQLLNPIMPYQMAEDYLGEIGNNTMEGDIEVTLIPGVKMYAALFLDDFHTDESPFDYPGFGWAILGGTMMADPFGINNTYIILEYARVEPWAYTHKGTIQDPPIPTTYKHFDEPLGHWIGPNSDDLFAQITRQINRNMKVDISYNRIRHGEIGGNIYDVADYEKEEKKFLKGIVETRRAVNIGLEYTTFHRLGISIDYGYLEVKNRQREEVNLPKSDKRRRDWKPGWNTTENEFRVMVQFRY